MPSPHNHHWLRYGADYRVENGLFSEQEMRRLLLFIASSLQDPRAWLRIEQNRQVVHTMLALSRYGGQQSSARPTMIDTRHWAWAFQSCFAENNTVRISEVWSLSIAWSYIAIAGSWFASVSVLDRSATTVFTADFSSAPLTKASRKRSCLLFARVVTGTIDWWAAATTQEDTQERVLVCFRRNNGRPSEGMYITIYD